MTYRKVAFEAAHLAGKRLMKYYHHLKRAEIYKKSVFDLVTKADLEANQIIIKTIKRYYPNHDFLSEETGLEDNPDVYEWVIDPLDGTSNYVIGSPMFCIAIALRKQSQILLSVQYTPVTDELYYAEHGKGAYLNNIKLSVSRTTKLLDSMITFARSKHPQSRNKYVQVQKELQGKVLNMRHFGSTALTLAYVAAGRVAGGIVMPPGITSWDILPGVLLVREAGGTVTDLEGKRWTSKSQGIVATNGRIHKQLLNIIQ